MRRKVKSVKKYNFKSVAKKMTIYGLILQLVLSSSGCVNKKVSNYETNINSTSSVSVQTNATEKPLACSKRQYSSNDIDVFFTTGVSNVLNSINSIEITYPYQELFNEEYSVNNYVGDTTKNKVHDISILSGGLISSSSLYSKVLENNKNYTNKTLKSELSNSEIQKICEYISEAINNLISSGKVNDINEVSCTLSDLKIFEISSMNDASVNGDNCLLVTPKIINNNAKKHTDFDYYKYVIQHEAIHLVQHSCKHVIGDVNYKFGFTETKDNENVNMYEYLWLSEANASYESSTFQNQKPISYTSYISHGNLIDYTNVFNNYNNSIVSLGLSKNINDLYKYFNVNSESDEREIDRFMFASDIVLNSNKKFFNTLYKTNSNISDSTLKQDMRISMSKFLTKNFYRSLIINLNNNKVSLNDIFYFINVFEAELDSKIYYSSEYDYDINKEFLEFYKGIQDDFFELISLNIGISFEEIVSKFNNYSLYKEDGITINTTNNYNSNIKNILNKLHNDNTYFQGNIRQYNEYYKNLKGYTK